MATFQVQYSFLRAAPAVSLRNTTTALYSFLHGLHIHPCYDAGSAEDGPTRVLHLGSLLTLSRSDKEVLSLPLDRGKYLHLLTSARWNRQIFVANTNAHCQICGPPMAQLFPRGRKLPSLLRTIILRSHHGFVQVYTPSHGASYALRRRHGIL